jgi:hypothetical protein
LWQRLIKLAVRVIVTTTRVRISFATLCAEADPPSTAKQIPVG